MMAPLHEGYWYPYKSVLGGREYSLGLLSLALDENTEFLLRKTCGQMPSSKQRTAFASYQFHWALTLDFLDSRMVRNKFLFYVIQSQSFCYCSTKGPTLRCN
jgi:hypothetical protein